MTFILNIIIIIIILGIIILVHELGHLIACKLTKVYVEEFAIGMGPKIYSRKIGETIYSIRVFPIGGFNKIRGEEYEEGDEEKVDTDPRSLQNQKPLVKAFIYLSGVFMNILLAILIFYISLVSMSFQWLIDPSFKDFDPAFGEVGAMLIEDRVAYSQLIEGGAAYEAGLPEEGYIESIDGVEISYSYEVSENVSKMANEEVTFLICTEDEICNDYFVTVGDNGMVGILLYENYITYVEYKGIERPFVGFLHIVNWFKLMGVAIGDMFSEASQTGDYEQVTMSVAGPVGLYVVIDYVRGFGLLPLADITANISLSIAFFNLLPIPALDGGRAIMLLAEVVSGKKLNRKVEAWAIHISFILLILLMVLVLFKDVIYFERLKELFT